MTTKKKSKVPSLEAHTLGSQREVRSEPPEYGNGVMKIGIGESLEGGSDCHAKSLRTSKKVSLVIS